MEQALREAGCDVVGWCDSPITGGDGNREFLVHARTPDRRGSIAAEVAAEVAAETAAEVVAEVPVAVPATAHVGEDVS